MSNPARGMYQQLRAHDRAIEKASLRVHERVVEQSKANAALARLNPHDGLHAAGHACAVHTSDELHASCERGATLLRWCGRDDTLIDRHDARALLDTVREAPPWQPGPRPGPRLSDDAAREERLAQFERYKDLVRLLKRGLGGAEQPRGLALVESEALQRRVAAVGHTAPTAREMRVPAAAAGAAPALARGGSDDDDDDGSEDSEDEAAAALAAACGIADYGWHVRDEKRRAAEAAGAGPAAPHITKRDRKRARRRILEAERNGQAPPADAVALLKEAAEAAQQVPAERGRPSERGHSPSYAPYRRRSASRSASPWRRSGAAAVPEPAPVKEFISEFAMPASAVARAHDSDGDDALLFSDAPDTRPPAAAAAPARRPAVTPAVAPARKETPAERLKRLMSAQLNQQIAKDAAAEAAKLHAVARERAVIARRDDAARDAGIRPAPALPPRHPQPEAHRARRESRDDASRSSSRSRSRSRRSRSHSRGRRRRSSSSSSDSRRHRRRSRSRRRRHRRSRSRSRSRSRRRSRSTSRSGRRRESRRSESRSRSRRRSR